MIALLRQDYKFTIAQILPIVKMSQSSYYDALKRSYREDNPTVLTHLRALRKKHPDYGCLRMVKALAGDGIIINHKAVERLMRKHGLTCHAYERKIQKYNSYKGTQGRIASNRLRRHFYTDRPYQKIVTDVTELRWGAGTTGERAYLTVYLDLFSNEVLTWNIGLSPTVAFVVDPLKELIDSRPAVSYRMTVHSDQGIQYQHVAYQNILKDNRVFQSMSRKATCLDNAVVESFFHILKVGTVHNHHYATYQDLSTAVAEYIPYYNNDRIRIKLAGMSPVEYREHASQSAA